MGLINIVDIGVCWKLCFNQNPAPGLITACKFTTGISRVLGIINSIINSIKVRPDITDSPYCKIAEDNKMEELLGAGAIAEEEVGTEKSDTAEEVT